MQGKPDPLEAVSAQVKAHFTRQCTASAAQHAVKSSMMLDMGAKAGKTRTKAGPGEGAPVENDVVAGQDFHYLFYGIVAVSFSVRLFLGRATASR